MPAASNSGTNCEMAGGGSSDTIGDGGPATDAWLYTTFGVALGPAGEQLERGIGQHEIG